MFYTTQKVYRIEPNNKKTSQVQSVPLDMRKKYSQELIRKNDESNVDRDVWVMNLSGLALDNGLKPVFLRIKDTDLIDLIQNHDVMKDEGYPVNRYGYDTLMTDPKTVWEGFAPYVGGQDITKLKVGPDQVMITTTKEANNRNFEVVILPKDKLEEKGYFKDRPDLYPKIGKNELEKYIEGIFDYANYADKGLKYPEKLKFVQDHFGSADTLWVNKGDNAEKYGKSSSDQNSVAVYVKDLKGDFFPEGTPDYLFFDKTTFTNLWKKNNAIAGDSEDSGTEEGDYGLGIVPTMGKGKYPYEPNYDGLKYNEGLVVLNGPNRLHSGRLERGVMWKTDLPDDVLEQIQTARLGGEDKSGFKPLIAMNQNEFNGSTTANIVDQESTAKLGELTVGTITLPFSKVYEELKVTTEDKYAKINAEKYYALLTETLTLNKMTMLPVLKGLPQREPRREIENYSQIFDYTNGDIDYSKLPKDLAEDYILVPAGHKTTSGAAALCLVNKAKLKELMKEFESLKDEETLIIPPEPEDKKDVLTEEQRKQIADHVGKDYTDKELPEGKYWKWTGGYDKFGKKTYIMKDRPKDRKPPKQPVVEGNKGMVQETPVTDRYKTLRPSQDQLEQLAAKEVKVGSIVGVDKTTTNTFNGKALPTYFQDEEFIVVKILNDRVICRLKRDRNITVAFKITDITSVGV